MPRHRACGILPRNRGAVASCSGLLFLLTACDPGKEGTTSQPPAAEATETVLPWPLTRGGPSLSGRVPAPVPRDPEIAWTFSLGAPGTAEAAAADGTLIVGDVMGVLHAIDFESHQLRWKFETGDSIEAAAAIDGGKVFFGSGDGSFRALDLASGKEIWSYKGGDKFSSAPNLIPAPGGGVRIAVNGYDGITRCLDPADGRVVWTYETNDYINGTPALVDGKLAFGGCDSVLHVLDAATGAKLNTIATDSQITDSIATDGTTLYAANYANQVVAADAGAAEPAWIYESNDFPFFSSPAVDANHVYIGCRDKALHAIRRSDGTRAWTFPTGGRIESSPVAFDDAVVFASSDGRLYAADPATGSEIWRLDLGEKLTASPVFAFGHLVLGGGDGTVFVIR